MTILTSVIAVVNDYEIVSALLIMGGGLLIASYQEDNRATYPQEDFRRARVIAEARRWIEEGITTKQN